MKIGIDARLYQQTGVGRYIRNLLHELGQLDKENLYYIFLNGADFDKFKCPNARWQKIKLNISWHSLKEQLLLPFILAWYKLDLMHFPYFNVPVFYPYKYLLTTHDLIVDHFNTGRASTLPPFLYQLKRVGYKIISNISIWRASRITVISQATRKELEEHYKASRGKISVTYDALDGNFFSLLKKINFKPGYNFPYILYVGNAYPHKNLERLVDAFMLVRKTQKIKLVLAGDDDYFYPRLKKYSDRKRICEDVIYFGNANDNELIDLYKGSRLVVFPSLMEGFGLPNFEALACGKLPVVSDIPVFREIWKDDLIYFNPYNTADIAGAIKIVLNFKDRKYREFVNAAAKRVRDYSWKKTAEMTKEIYQLITK